jgi:hypothetical protein
MNSIRRREEPGILGALRELLCYCYVEAMASSSMTV